MRLTAEERTVLRKHLCDETTAQTWHGFLWATSERVLTSLDDAEAEITRLKGLLRSLYWCAVNDTRVDPKVEDTIRTVLGERPQEHGGEQT